MQKNEQIFRWVNIAINTWVAEIPIGWLIKSIDTKNDLATPEEATNNDDEKKVTIAMSNSMEVIEDPYHTWNFGKFRWTNIGKDTWRAMVNGGWIVKCVDVKRLTYFNSLDFDNINISSAMKFVSDPSHSWRLVKPEPKIQDIDNSEEPDDFNQ